MVIIENSGHLRKFVQLSPSTQRYLRHPSHLFGALLLDTGTQEMYLAPAHQLLLLKTNMFIHLLHITAAIFFYILSSLSIAYHIDGFIYFSRSVNLKKFNNPENNVDKDGQRYG